MTTPLESRATMRLAQVAGGEHALHHQLIGSVRGHGEEGAAENSGPEGVGLGEVEGEVEEVELARGCCDCVDLRPSAGDMGAEGDDGDDGSGDVDDHLHDVGPDDGGHAAFEGVEQREGGDDGDGEHIAACRWRCRRRWRRRRRARLRLPRA